MLPSSEHFRFPPFDHCPRHRPPGFRCLDGYRFESRRIPTDRKHSPKARNLQKAGASVRASRSRGAHRKNCAENAWGGGATRALRQQSGAERSCWPGQQATICCASLAPHRAKLFRARNCHETFNYVYVAPLHGPEMGIDRYRERCRENFAPRLSDGAYPTPRKYQWLQYNPRAGSRKCLNAIYLRQISRNKHRCREPRF